MKVINDGIFLKGKVIVVLIMCIYVIVKILILVVYDYWMWLNVLGFFKYFKKIEYLVLIIDIL